MSKQATWIWYPGDFEVWLGNIFNNRRTERGAMFPPFWKQDSHWPTVEFTKSFLLDESETITIATEGKFNFTLDGKLQTSIPQTFRIPKGEHQLSFKVWNQATPPAIFIDGQTIKTDSSWQTTYEDKIWIDENGVSHGSGIYVPAASWNFDRIDTSPSQYRLERKRLMPISKEDVNSGQLYDFGREVFGYLKVVNIRGTIHIFYGESREEALDTDYCETLDILSSCAQDLESKAFRYVFIETEAGSKFDDVYMEFEYTPFDEKHSGSFTCNDEDLNKIWEVSAYTMDLTTREFFMDGIKRDRWTWSGDAIQSYLMNYYLRFDTECVKRTIRQLRGKDPVTAHINTIMDYTFYWFKSVIDYYEYTGDKDFVREIWPRMISLMDYVLSRTNAEGFAEGLSDDWIFVDWVDFSMHKRGSLAFEQVLFVCALNAMQKVASICDDNKSGEYYSELSSKVSKNLMDTFWSEEKHAFLHAIEDGAINDQITKFPNMFAFLCLALSEDKKQQIIQNVMLNPSIPPITTPYMRFYELEALCQAGLYTQVLHEIRDYWGGMLREGATSFWEKYNKEESGIQHLAMYGRPYGKSLCHAWGASPIYLLGKYFLGVQPTKPGYEEYIVKPHLGHLEWIKGDVPTPFGLIHIEMTANRIIIISDGGHGILHVNDKNYEIPANQEIRIDI